MMQMDMQRKKEKERVQKEIDKLREAIQTLTKAYELKNEIIFEVINY